MSLYGRFTRVGPSGFGHASTAEQVTAGQDLSGQTWLVTGCNSGLGAETGRVLASRGARVLATARTEGKATDAVAGWAGAVPLLLEPRARHRVCQRRVHEHQAAAPQPRPPGIQEGLYPRPTA